MAIPIALITIVGLSPPNGTTVFAVEGTAVDRGTKCQGMGMRVTFDGLRGNAIDPGAYGMKEGR